MRILSVPGCTLRAMEQTTHDVAGWVDRIDDIAVGMTDTALRTDGSVPPPTVHFVLDCLDPPYVGYLTSRPMYRGEDAVQAVRAMGLMGSMLGAARLVVAYENDDLSRALELPDADQAPPGVVVIDADRDAHEVRWRPVRFHRGPPNAAGGATVLPEWGPGPALPAGPAAAASCGRPVGGVAGAAAVVGGEFVRAFAAMEVGGYLMRWVARPEGERDQPAWMRLLAPIM